MNQYYSSYTSQEIYLISNIQLDFEYEEGDEITILFFNKKVPVLIPVESRL